MKKVDGWHAVVGGDKGLHRDEILNAYRLLRTLLGTIRGKTLPHSSTPGEWKKKKIRAAR